MTVIITSIPMDDADAEATLRFAYGRPWAYKNDSIEAGFSKVGNAGEKILLWAWAVRLAFRRVMVEDDETLTRAIDAHFYAVALRNLSLVSRWAGRYLGSRDIRQAVKQFNRRVPSLVPVRDINEHPERYLTGEGKLQKRRHLPRDFTYRWTQTVREGRFDDFLVEIDGFRLEVRSSFRAALDLVSTVMDTLESMKRQP